MREQKSTVQDKNLAKSERFPGDLSLPSMREGGVAATSNEVLFNLRAKYALFKSGGFVIGPETKNALRETGAQIEGVVAKSTADEFKVEPLRVINRGSTARMTHLDIDIDFDIAVSLPVRFAAVRKSEMVPKVKELKRALREAFSQAFAAYEITEKAAVRPFRAAGYVYVIQFNCISRENMDTLGIGSVKFSIDVAVCAQKGKKKNKDARTHCKGKLRIFKESIGRIAAGTEASQDEICRNIRFFRAICRELGIPKKKQDKGIGAAVAERLILGCEGSFDKAITLIYEASHPQERIDVRALKAATFPVRRKGQSVLSAVADQHLQKLVDFSKHCREWSEERVL